MRTRHHYSWVMNFLKQLNVFDEETIKNIAWSGTYVDYNEDHKSFIIKDLPKVFKNERFKDDEYSPVCTAHDKLDNMIRAYIFDKEEDFKKVYVPFHFFPHLRVFLTTVKNPILLQKWIKETITDILKLDPVLEEYTRKTYRLGILTHAYLDSFTHEGFVGHLVEYNNVSNVKINPELKEPFKNKITRWIVPGIGHAKLLNYPDRHDIKLSFERSLTGKKEERNNIEVFKEAFDSFFYLFKEVGSVKWESEYNFSKLNEENPFFDKELLIKKSLKPKNFWAKKDSSHTDPFLHLFKKEFYFLSPEYFIFHEEALKIRKEVLEKLK